MFDFLYGFPDLVISAIFGIVLALIVAGLPYLVCPLIRMTRDKDLTDFAISAQSTVITFIAIILGFSLVDAQDNLRAVETHISTEANAINQMDRLLLRYGDPKVADMRNALADYAQSIITVEWPMLVQDNQGDLRTKASPPFGRLSRAVYTIEPSPGRQTEIFNQILKQIDELSDMRSQRIKDANVRIPAAFWEVTLALFGLLFVLALLIEPKGGRSVAIGGQVLAVALLLSLVFIYDVPFKGQTSVQPDEFGNVLTIMKNRTS